ncbi:MAG: metallophosphoesterase, partial [Xanthomonadales bacterium]|nr:metallophosphoesterase [Xanthomonadales bacterium]
VVLSDLEGNSQFLDAALRKLGVVDDAGRWQFGHGQLVILGDSVDRGRNVFQVLWRLHGLSLQASAAGGAVHMVLGNHDQYLLRTIVSRANHDYLFALQQLDGYHATFADDTLLGAWLRKQPVMLKLGSVLFVHGGVSPHVAKSGFTVPQINQAMREYWRQAGKKVRHTQAFDAVIGRSGVTQYRGYFYGGKGDADKDIPLVNREDVKHILTAFNATQIVVAHTLVERVQSLFGGLVYAVDVNYHDARPQVLVYEHGVPKVVNIGIHRGLDHQHVVTKQREFSVFDHADRQLVRQMIAEYQREADIPWPY